MGIERGGLLTRDLLPGLAPYLGLLKGPLGTLGMAAVASGLCGMFLHPQGFVVLLGILAVTALGLAWPWLSVRGLGGSLGFDRSRCREGEPVTARLTLRNRMPWGAWGVSIRGGFHDDNGDGRHDIPLAGLALVTGRRTIAVAVEFVPDCRGLYPARPPRLACGFPFGLWEASRPLEVAAPLLAWPRTVPVGPVPEAEGLRASEGLATQDRPGHWGDPDARSGVGDGDNEVSASEHPESVGFTESEVYLETDRPSLYDAYNESYGRSLRLIEWRARWAGRARPSGLTLARRYLPVAGRVAGEPRSALEGLVRLADWAAHAPEWPGPPAPESEIRRTCRSALRAWTLSRFRREAPSPWNQVAAT